LTGCSLIEGRRALRSDLVYPAPQCGIRPQAQHTSKQCQTHISPIPKVVEVKQTPEAQGRPGDQGQDNLNRLHSGASDNLQSMGRLHQARVDDLGHQQPQTREGCRADQFALGGAMSRGVLNTLALPSLEFAAVQSQRPQPDVAHGAFAHVERFGQCNIRGYLVASKCRLHNCLIDCPDSVEGLFARLPRSAPGRTPFDKRIELIYTGHGTPWPPSG